MTSFLAWLALPIGTLSSQIRKLSDEQLLQLSIEGRRLEEEAFAQGVWLG